MSRATTGRVAKYIKSHHLSRQNQVPEGYPLSTSRNLSPTYIQARLERVCGCILPKRLINTITPMFQAFCSFHYVSLPVFLCITSSIIHVNRQCATRVTLQYCNSEISHPRLSHGGHTTPGGMVTPLLLNGSHNIGRRISPPMNPRDSYISGSRLRMPSMTTSSFEIRRTVPMI
jgi:hypothetical protein